jgi:DNA repair photolyase
MAHYNGSAVYISITTLDGELARKMEPRATQPAGRLTAIQTLAQAGVPVGVFASPIIPGLNDHEIPVILEAARAAGAVFAGCQLVRLPLGVEELFQTWLEQHYPERKEKVLQRIRLVRNGRLSDSRFKVRMTGEGPMAKMVMEMFRLHRDRLGYSKGGPQMSVAHFRRPSERSLFDENS